MAKKQYYSDEYLRQLATLQRTNKRIKEAHTYGNEYEVDVLTGQFERLQRKMRGGKNG